MSAGVAEWCFAFDRSAVRATGNHPKQEAAASVDTAGWQRPPPEEVPDVDRRPIYTDSGVTDRLHNPVFEDRVVNPLPPWCPWSNPGGNPGR